MEMLERAFKDPLVLHPDFHGRLPAKLLKEVPYERAKQVLQCYAEDKPIEEAPDIEAILYFYSLGAVHPDAKDGFDLYAHLIYNFARARNIDIPEKIAEYRDLAPERLEELKRFKRWIQKAKDDAYRLEKELFSKFKPRRG